jgi:hypothetical protein
MPTRTKEAVAVLSMAKDAEQVPGVGTRVSANTFWLTDNDALLDEYKEDKNGFNV